MCAYAYNTNRLDSNQAGEADPLSLMQRRVSLQSLTLSTSPLRRPLIGSSQ